MGLLNIRGERFEEPRRDLDAVDKEMNKLVADAATKKQERETKAAKESVNIDFLREKIVDYLNMEGEVTSQMSLDEFLEYLKERQHKLLAGEYDEDKKDPDAPPDNIDPKKRMPSGDGPDWDGV